MSLSESRIPPLSDASPPKKVKKSFGPKSLWEHPEARPSPNLLNSSKKLLPD